MPYRALLAHLEKWFTLPDINPSWYTTISVALSVVFVYAPTLSLKALIIGLVLLADWLDGATARQHRRIQKSGYLIDTVTDRASEAFIFAADSGMLLGQVFFLLWILNCGFAFYSARSGKHVSLPLRFVYMLLLVAQSGWK